MNQRLLIALHDVATYTGKYIWKKASMKALEEMGLVQKTGEIYYSHPVYEITDLGRKILAGR